MHLTKLRKGAALAAVTALSLLVAACFFAPGKFVSDLTVGKDRSFSFHYAGEIYLLPLAEASKKAEFKPDTCYDDDLNERACNSDELAEQKQNWQREQDEKKKSDAQAAQYMFGGINPSDPKAAEEIADRMRRQAGWNKVEYLGNGKYDVDFAISGKLDRDFAFPSVERFPMANAFVQLSVRGDGTVRIDAPGFGPASSTMGTAAMMQGMSLKDDNAELQGAAADGTFTLHTDAQVLANNTDEGPVRTAKGSDLTWKVNARSPAAPTALIKFAP